MEHNALSRRKFVLLSSALATTACANQPMHRKDADVIIVGAGLSGLNAATILERAGYNVLVLEASDRIGGRLWTLDDLPGRPEAGGIEIGRSYKRLIQRADENGIAINFESTPRDKRVLILGKSIIDTESWKSHPQNPFPDEFKTYAPDRVLFAALGSSNPFENSTAWRSATGIADLDAKTFLQKKGFDANALALINVALNANELENYSVANLYRSMQLFQQAATQGPAGRIVGGSQRLPEAMANALRCTVRTTTQVRSISSTANGVTIRANADLLHAEFCIMAVPLPALTGIMIDPRPGAGQTEAMTTLPYTQILQLHLEPEIPFWERDGYPPMIWSDSLLERIFLTRNNNGSITGLKVWINGNIAYELSKQTDLDLEALAQKELARIRPASEGRVRLLKAIRWTKQSLAGGGYMHWGPGQIGRWAKTMGAPIGRIHFAGEHLSYRHTGMEGAMESGEAAAKTIMDISASL